MENSYSMFYDKFFTQVVNGKASKIHKHPNLSSEHIQSIIETIFARKNDLIQHEYLIRSTFGFDVTQISSVELTSKHNIEEDEYVQIIGKFIRYFIYSLYFKVQVYKVFLIFLIGFFMLSSLNILFYDFEYYLNLVKNNIIEVIIVLGIFVLVIPFLSFSKSYIMSCTINILKQYE
jgi:hypothetical protein